MILIEASIQARFGRSLRRRALAAFLRQAQEAIPLHGAIAVQLMTDAHIRRLNRTFRRKDQPTDVLSFPASDPPGPAAFAGDLAVSVETAARQARALGHPLSVELQILALHGLLHLAGFDHEADSGAMARREASLRRRFGLPASLIERNATPAEARSRSRRRRP